MKRILRAILSMTLVFVLGFGVIAGLTQIFESDDTEVASQETTQQESDKLAFSDTLTPEDCLPSEVYDEATSSCYYECDTDEECAEIEAQLDTELAQIYQDSETKITSETPPENKLDQIDYNVVGRVIDPVSETGTIHAADQEVWDLFLKIAPDGFITEHVQQYQTYNNADDDTAAYVAALPNQPDKWLLAVNIAATHDGEDLLKAEVTKTLIHEFAHILTLESDQVPPAEWENTTDEACETFFTGEGCSNEDSYINSFFTKYWATIFDERLESDEADSTFYEKYQEQFVNDYAATNPGEDIAESFTAFILNPKPDDNSVADEKVRFFYEYEELVTLRSQIRARIR